MNNWRWRLLPAELHQAQQEAIRLLVEESGRG